MISCGINFYLGVGVFSFSIGGGIADFMFLNNRGLGWTVFTIIPISWFLLGSQGSVILMGEGLCLCISCVFYVQVVKAGLV